MDICKHQLTSQTGHTSREMNQVYTHRQLQAYVDAVATLPRIHAHWWGGKTKCAGKVSWHFRPSNGGWQSVSFAMSPAAGREPLVRRLCESQSQRQRL